MLPTKHVKLNEKNSDTIMTEITNLNLNHVNK